MKINRPTNLYFLHYNVLKLYILNKEMVQNVQMYILFFFYVLEFCVMLFGRPKFYFNVLKSDILEF